MAVGSSAPPRSQEEVEQVRDEPNLFLNTWVEVQATGEWSGCWRLRKQGVESCDRYDAWAPHPHLPLLAY